MSRRRRALAVGLLGAAVGARAPAARSLAAPAGRVVLTVTGRGVNTSGRAAFDMAMLASLPQLSFTTRTPWHAQARKFTGPLLRDVLVAARARGRVLRAAALDDYRVDIPFEDAQRHDVLLARLLDDKPVPVRDRGPLLIVYPFDSKPELRSPVYYSRSAWQLKSLEIL